MTSKFYFIGILALVGAVVVINQLEKQAIDYSKLPEKVESSRGFQRWITNLKNKDFEIEADEFRLLEENEIYNTKWMKVYSVDQEGIMEEYENKMAQAQDVKKVAFSPSERQFVDYRDERREDYLPNEAHFYGLRDNKILDARIVDCSLNANCYFDRAYFLEDSNDVIVISEFSRNIKKRDTTATPCSSEELCTYTIKIHVIDLLRNSRLVYESKPFDIVLSEVKPEL